MDSANLKLAVFIFVSCQAGHAQDAATKHDEPKFRAGVEEAAVSLRVFLLVRGLGQQVLPKLRSS
jgi:hypothetical protein